MAKYGLERIIGHCQQREMVSFQPIIQTGQQSLFVDVPRDNLMKKSLSRLYEKGNWGFSLGSRVIATNLSSKPHIEESYTTRHMSLPRLLSFEMLQYTTFGTEHKIFKHSRMALIFITII